MQSVLYKYVINKFHTRELLFVKYKNVCVHICDYLLMCCLITGNEVPSITRNPVQYPYMNRFLESLNK